MKYTGTHRALIIKVAKLTRAEEEAWDAVRQFDPADCSPEAKHASDVCEAALIPLNAAKAKLAVAREAEYALLPIIAFDVATATANIEAVDKRLIDALGTYIMEFLRLVVFGSPDRAPVDADSMLDARCFLSDAQDAQARAYARWHFLVDQADE